MTDSTHAKTSRRASAPGALLHLTRLESEGAGKAGCALHPRSRVQQCTEETHTSIQGSGEHPTFPAQWFDGLYRARPGVSGFAASVAREYGCQRPVGMTGLRGLDADH